MFRKLCALLAMTGVVLVLVSAATIFPKNPTPEDLLMVLQECQLHVLIALAVFFFGVTISATSILLETTAATPVSEPLVKPAEAPEEKPVSEPVQPKAPEPIPEPVKAVESPKPEPAPLPKPEEKPVEVKKPATPAVAPDAAFQILSLLQKEGRLLDFLMEDIAEIDDESLGGGIRPIHEGCRKILKERLIIEPVLTQGEGSDVQLETVDPHAVKLTGNVPPAGPYKGVLVHRGWQLKECKLPELVSGWTGNVVAPAEVEIQ